jgi:hypothetical protein
MANLEKVCLKNGVVECWSIGASGSNSSNTPLLRYSNYLILQFRCMTSVSVAFFHRSTETSGRVI